MLAYWQRLRASGSPYGSELSKDEGEEDPPPDGIVLGNRLLDKELQDWALGLWFLVLFAVLYALHAPVSCAQHTEEQAMTPSRCHLVGDSGALRLPDYCWWPCAAYLRTCLLLSVSFAMVMQAAVVILNHPGCNTCLRLWWHFDLSDMLGIADRDGKADQVLFMIKHPIMAIRDMGIKRFVHHSSKSLLLGTLVSKISLIGVCNAIMQTGFFFAYSLSTFSSFFECADKDGNVHEVGSIRSNYTELASAGFAFLLQLNIFWLVWKAEWTKQIQVHVKSQEELLRQFTAVAQELPDQPPRYFPLEKPPDEYYALLKRVFLLELVAVEQDGLHMTPHELGSVCGLITLHFKTPSKKQSLESYHRKRSSASLFLGVILMFFASQSCWTCVKGIRVHPRLTAYEVDKLLLLMGACGRHHSVGFPCWLASIALTIAFLQQLVIMASSKVQERSSRMSPIREGSMEFLEDPPDADEHTKALLDHQLTANVLDMRRTIVLDPQRYRDAGAAMPTVPCHVWVMDVGNQEKPMDCSDSESVCQRFKWVRSKRPRTVHIAEEPDVETKQSWMRGLVRSEYNPPVQCIEFSLTEKEGGSRGARTPSKGSSKMVKQIVPPEFVAGHFHAWIVLGPREAWEKFSIGLTCGAVFLAAFDVFMFFFLPQGKVLTNCHEVLTGQCVSFGVRPDDPDSPIVFRVSVGLWASLAGAFFSVLGALGLRVCIDLRKQWEGVGAPTCRLYVAALGTGVVKLLGLAANTNIGFCTYVAKRCCLRCQSGKKPTMQRRNALDRLE